VSPILAGSIAFVLFKSLQNLIIDTSKPFENAKKYVPFYMFLVGFVISLDELLEPIIPPLSITP
jgi:PiT family inorganic phosphate transporter